MQMVAVWKGHYNSYFNNYVVFFFFKSTNLKRKKPNNNQKSCYIKIHNSSEINTSKQMQTINVLIWAISVTKLIRLINLKETKFSQYNNPLAFCPYLSERWLDLTPSTTTGHIMLTPAQPFKSLDCSVWELNHYPLGPQPESQPRQLSRLPF